MKKTILAFVIVGIAGGAGTSAVACSSSSNGVTVKDAGSDVTTGGEGGGGEAGAPFAVTLPCTDTDDSVYADPGDVSGKAKGDILKCAKDPDLTAAAMLAVVSNTVDAGTPNYQGKPFTSGAHVYRILYRTERGDSANSPGYSSGLAYIPDTPRKGATTPLPIILAAHGSRGQTGKCAPSKDDPAAADVAADYVHLVYPFIGLGFPVIMPDLAGYANYGGTNNPPSPYDGAQDLAKSNLDAVKAFRNLVPDGLTQKVVVVGHSQGGLAALDTLVLSSTYGLDGTIAGVAVYSPLWFSQRGFGALFLAPGTYPIATTPEGPVSIWYHYTHSELLDGPGHGIDLFLPSKQAVVKSFVDNDCWSESYPDLIEAGTSANDFFLPSYINSIATPASPLGNGNCNGDAVCQKWIDRMTADYPHFTGSALQVPILVWYPNGDQSLTPDLAQCVYNRLSADGTNYKACYDPNPVGHGGAPAVDNNYVVDWAAQQALGDPAPTEPCQQLSLNEAGVPQLVDEGGAPIGCNQFLSTE